MARKQLPEPKPAVKRSSRRADPDDEVTAQRPTRRMSTGDRQQAELTAALRAKLTGEPVFAFPPELSAEHQPYWVEVVNSKPHDYFNLGDIHLLKLYCRVAADIDRMDREIVQEGSVVINARGNPIVNPRVIVRSMAETRLLSLSTKLRMQPSSRYASDQDREQANKKRKADNAARTLHDDDGDDDDSLIAGGYKMQ
jgi:phage terminase small subunit